MNVIQIIENVLQSLVSGISVGCLYGLMCLGLGLIFGTMRVVNFAQGSLMMLGMYAAWYFFTGFGIVSFLGPYVGPFAAALLAAPLMFVVGYVLHRMFISRVTGSRASKMEGEGHYAQLILTLGIALVVENGALMIFGSTPISVRTPLASSAWEIELAAGQISLLVNKARLISGIISIATAISLFLLVSRTRLGKSLRAAADNPIASLYVGVNVDRCHSIGFGLGSAISAIAGGLLATYYPFQPYVGFDFIIIMYTGVVLGGLGSIAGAFWGGMTIGLVQQLSTLVMPQQLQNTAIFIVFLLIVFLRPQGFFGKNVERA